MRRLSTLFLQAVVALTGIGTLALMLWEPHLEGRNAHTTLFQIYFNDPFLAYVYAVSILFFIALYQAFKVLGYVRQNKVFSAATGKALRTIKWCAVALVGFIAAADAYLFVLIRGSDDIAGGVAVSLFLMFVSGVIAAAATMFEGIVQNAIVTSENSLRKHP